MIASSSVVLANLAYLIGAVLLAFIGGFAVWLRHRKPKSIDANVASFNRGLRALAPDAAPRRRGQADLRATGVRTPEAGPPMRSVRTARSFGPQAGPSVLVRPAPNAAPDAPAAGGTDERLSEPDPAGASPTAAAEGPGHRPGGPPG